MTTNSGEAKLLMELNDAAIKCGEYASPDGGTAGVVVVATASKQQRKEQLIKSRMFRTYYTKTGITIHQCTECQYKTEYSTAIRDHVNKEHIKKVLTCTECTYETFMSKALNHHRRKVHGLLAMTCPVEGCSYKSINLDHMRGHVDAKHPEMRGKNVEFQAQVHPPPKRRGASVGVGKGNGGLRTAPYTRSVDPASGKYVYACHFCPFSTKSVMQLTSHQNVKHFMRPIQCSECNYSTLHYGTFYTHCKSVHKMSKRDCIVPNCKFKWLRDEAIQMHLWRKHSAFYDEKEHAIKVYV